MLLGHSLTLQVSGGEIVLGQWQRVLVAELDGPRARTLRVQIMGSHSVSPGARPACLPPASPTSPEKLDAGDA